VSCKGHANWVVEGDLPLFNALVKYADDIGAAFNQTLALVEPIGKLAGDFGKTLAAAGDLTAAGAVCATGALQVAGEANVSINVSVKASASVQGKASTT